MRGAVCVFPPGEDKPTWIPDPYVKPVDSTFKESSKEAVGGNDDGQHPGESHSSGADCVEPGKEPPQY